MPSNTVYNLVDTEGNAYSVTGDDALAQARLAGSRFQTEEENIDAASAAAERARYAGTGSAVRGVIEAGARAATIGLSDVALGAIGDKYDREDIRGRRAAHPTLNTAVEIGTGVALGIGALGKGAVGAFARGTPSGFISGQAARIAGTSGGRLAATLPRAAAAGLFEGTVQNFGMNLGGVATGNLDATAESLVIDPIKGGAVGGLLGGVLHGGERGVGSIRKKIRASDMFDATPEAVDAATREAQQAVDGGLRVADATTDAAIAELAAARAQHLELDLRLRQGLAAKRAEQQAIQQAEAAPAGAWDGADTAKHVDNEAALNAARDRATAVEARAARAGRKEAVPEAVDAAGDATVKTEANAVEAAAHQAAPNEDAAINAAIWRDNWAESVAEARATAKADAAAMRAAAKAERDAARAAKDAERLAKAEQRMAAAEKRAAEREAMAEGYAKAREAVAKKETEIAEVQAKLKAEIAAAPEGAPIGQWKLEAEAKVAALKAEAKAIKEARASEVAKKYADKGTADVATETVDPTATEADAPEGRRVHPRDAAAAKRAADEAMVRREMRDADTQKLAAAEQTTATGAKVDVTEHDLTFSDQAFNDNIEALHAAGVTPETLHVPDPVTKVSPFDREMARLDPKVAALVTALEEVAPAAQKVRERWTVYGKHITDDLGRRSGPPLNLNIEELAEESIGRQKQAFKESNDRERLEILRALGPEKGRQLIYSLTDAERKVAFKSLGEARAAQLLEGVPSIRYNLFQKEQGGFGGAWEVPPAPAARTFAEQVKEVASKVDPGMRRGQFKVFLSDIRKDPAFAGMSDAEWADALFEARKKGDLTLGRIDMAGDDLARVEASAIRPKGGDAAAVQHYVEVPPAAVPVADDVVQATERWAQPEWFDDALSLSVPTPAARKPLYDAADEAADLAADAEVSAARRVARESAPMQARPPERTAKGSGPQTETPEQVFDNPYASKADLDDWTPAEVDNMTSFQEGVESIAALERSVKNLTEALGDRAPAEAQAFVQQMGDALADQERRSTRAAVHAIEADAVPTPIARERSTASTMPDEWMAPAGRAGAYTIPPPIGEALGPRVSWPGEVPIARPPPRLADVAGEIEAPRGRMFTEDDDFNLVDAGGVRVDRPVVSGEINAADVVARSRPGVASGQRPGFANEAQDAATLASRAPRPTPAPSGRGIAGKQGGLLSTLADAGAVLEAIQAVGVATPFDPDRIPLVGPILGAYLKFRALGMAGRKLGFRVPWTRGNAARARGQAVRSRMLKAVDGVLAGGQKALKVGAVVAASQSWRLKDVLDRGLDGAEVERAKRRTLKNEAELVKEHARVWRERAANPEIVRAQVLKQLTVDLDGDGQPDPLDPDLVERTVAVAQRKAEYLAKHTPVEPPPNLLYPSRWEPSYAEQVRFARRLRAVTDPETVYNDIRDGTLTTEAAEAFREVYPALYDDTRNALLARAAQGGLVLPPSHVASLSILFRVPLRPSLDPETIQRIQEAGIPPHPTGVPGGAALAAPPGGAPDLASASTVGPYRGP